MVIKSGSHNLPQFNTRFFEIDYCLDLVALLLGKVFLEFKHIKTGRKPHLVFFFLGA